VRRNPLTEADFFNKSYVGTTSLMTVLISFEELISNKNLKFKKDTKHFVEQKKINKNNVFDLYSVIAPIISNLPLYAKLKV